jgi:hypothetical protein
MKEALAIIIKKSYNKRLVIVCVSYQHNHHHHHHRHRGEI